LTPDRRTIALMPTYSYRTNPNGTVTRKRVAGRFLKTCLWMLYLGLLYAGIANGTAGIRAVSIAFAVITVGSVIVLATQHRHRPLR
jgi:hypothetical protein